MGGLRLVQFRVVVNVCHIDAARAVGMLATMIEPSNNLDGTRYCLTRPFNHG